MGAEIGWIDRCGDPATVLNCPFLPALLDTHAEQWRRILSPTRPFCLAFFNPRTRTMGSNPSASAISRNVSILRQQISLPASCPAHNLAHKPVAVPQPPLEPPRGPSLTAAASSFARDATPVATRWPAGRTDDLGRAIDRRPPSAHHRPRQAFIVRPAAS